MRWVSLPSTPPPTWRMLHARGQTLTFCTDHIHHYYHHCFSSNRAGHHIPVRPGHRKKWENGQQFSLHWLKGEEGRARVKKWKEGRTTVSRMKTKTGVLSKRSYTEVHGSVASSGRLPSVSSTINLRACLDPKQITSLSTSIGSLR